MKKHLNRLVLLGLLILFSFSIISLILSCLGCSVQPTFYLWAAALCVCVWVTTCTRNGMWIGLPLSALLLFAAYRFYPSDLNMQLNDALDRLTGAYMEQIVYRGEAYPYLNAASDHSLLFLFLLFLLSSYMGASLSSRSGRIGLALLGSAPFFITCLAVSVAPPVLPVFGLILFWFLLAVGGAHYHEDSDSYLRVLGSLLPLSLLLSLLLVYVKPKEYNYDPSTSAVTQTLEKLLHEIDARLDQLFHGKTLPDPNGLSTDDEQDSDSGHEVPDRPSIPWQDERGDMDLTRSPDLTELETVFLRVKAQKDGSLYLRAVSYGDYLGTAWACTEENTPVLSLSFAADALEAYGTDVSTLSVQFVQQSPYRYLPYFSTEEQGFDSFVPSGLATRYTARYQRFPASFVGLTLPADQADSETVYRSYAHEYYTRLPDSTRQTLQELCTQYGLYPDMEDPVTQVAAFVQHIGQYDPETSVYPSDDYAVFFLTSAKKGCCVHFATAAAALYRVLGIPARITEGFLLDGKAGETLDVKGYQAHAWVEIYQDGLGWLPVEVTGQSGLDSEALGAHDPDPDPDPFPEGNGPSPEPENPVQTSSAPLPVGLLSDSQTSSAGSASAGHVTRILFRILFLAALISALPVRRRILLLLRSRSYEQPDTRKAVIAMYHTAQRALDFGAEIPPILLEAAERAAFSQHEIAVEEAEACRDQLFIMLKSCYLRQKSWNRFRIKYLRALL